MFNCTHFKHLLNRLDLAPLLPSPFTCRSIGGCGWEGRVRVCVCVLRGSASYFPVWRKQVYLWSHRSRVYLYSRSMLCVCVCVLEPLWWLTGWPLWYLGSLAAEPCYYQSLVTHRHNHKCIIAHSSIQNVFTDLDVSSNSLGFTRHVAKCPVCRHEGLYIRKVCHNGW